MRMWIGCGAWVVGLVIVGTRLAGDGGPAAIRGEGFVFAQTGAGGDEVEDLHDLGAQAAREVGAAADSVLAGHAALFVSGRAER